MMSKNGYDIRTGFHSYTEISEIIKYLQDHIRLGFKLILPQQWYLETCSAYLLEWAQNVRKRL